MDFAELVTEAQIRSGVTDVASRAEHYVRSAERMLEKRLKVGAMERVVTLTADADGVVTLPADFLQWRTTGAGDVAGSAVSNARPGQMVNVQYYAKLPSITGGPNWLSEAEPELYIQAVLFQIYTANGLVDQAVATNTLLTAMLQQVEEADVRARYLNRRIDTAAFTPGRTVTAQTAKGLPGPAPDPGTDYVAIFEAAKDA